MLKPAEPPQTAVREDETPDSLVRDESESAQDENTALPVFTLDPEPSSGESQIRHISLLKRTLTVNLATNRGITY